MYYPPVPTSRSAARAAALGAVVLCALHLASLVVVLLPAWRTLAEPARAAAVAISGHVAAFQLELLAAVAAAGALFGLAAWAALTSLRVNPTAPRVAPLTLALLAAALARVVARRPAVFEDLLWRKGGARAALQVLLAEKVGAVALDRLLVSTLVAWAAISLWVNRRALRLPAVRGALVASSLALAAAVVPWPRHAARRSGTSLVVLAADSLRPENFSSEGYARATTPNLDALRKKGAWVADDFVPIASTTASWASMMTGLYPHTTGIRDLFPPASDVRLHRPTLATVLRERGWGTAVVSDYAGETFQRVDLGFETVDAPPATSIEVFAEREAFQRLPLALGLFSGPLGRRLFPVADYLPVNADPAALTERLLRQLERFEDDGRPFLLVAFYSVTHTPFAAPMPDAAAFTDPAYAGGSRYSYEIQQLDDLKRVGDRPPDADVSEVRALYDGALRAFDREVGRVLARLDEGGLTDRIVVVTGDHGESLFEPGATTNHGKWFAGGEAANRTALILQGTGVKPGTTIGGVASGVDFAPTLLDAVGAPVPPRLDGIPLLRTPPAPDRVVFAETALWLAGKDDLPPGAIAYPPILELLEVEPGSHALVLKQKYRDLTVTAKLRAARRGPWELVYTPTRGLPRWQLFDLEHDPYGENDLIAERLDVAKPLRDALFDWLAQDRLRWLDASLKLTARVER